MTTASSKSPATLAPSSERHRRLAIVVATAPARGDLTRAVALARAAAAAGVDTGIFVMDAAVAGLDALAALLDEGVEVIACATSCEAGRAGAPPGVLLGSQDDHAALVHRAHRVVAFT